MLDSYKVSLNFKMCYHQLIFFSWVYYFHLGCSQPALVGDGYCNDVTNSQQCNFDHGDCCLLNVNTDYCSNCSCSGSGVITSPGFPGNYDNNLDLTWIIQLPPGHLIEIVFLNNQIESGYVFFVGFLRLQFLLSNLFKL